MRPDDPLLRLINTARQPLFITFVETGVMSTELKDEIRTNPVCLFGLSIRAHYEETILLVLHLRRQIDEFVASMPVAIQSDLMASFSTDRNTPQLQDFLIHNSEVALKIKNFREFSSVSICVICGEILFPLCGQFVTLSVGRPGWRVGGGGSGP